MDAVIECVRNTVGEGVRRIRKSPKSKRKNSTPAEAPSKVFGCKLEDICALENCEVPYIVRDLAQYIHQNHLSSEGLFRLSAPATKTLRLRRAYEQHYEQQQQQQNEDSSAVSATIPPSLSVACQLEAGADVAACVLKFFFRHLSHPLLPEEVLRLYTSNSCACDETFALAVSDLVRKLPSCYLQTFKYLLTFLRCVLANGNNRMNARGLAVVFAPNLFAPPPPTTTTTNSPALVDLQTIANRAFERLLLESETLCNSDRPISLPDTPRIAASAATAPPNGDAMESGDERSLDVDETLGGAVDGPIDDVIMSSSSSEEEESAAAKSINHVINETIREVVYRRLFDSSTPSTPRSLTSPRDDVIGTDESYASTTLSGQRNKRQEENSEPERRHSSDNEEVFEFDDVISPRDEETEAVTSQVPRLDLSQVKSQQDDDVDDDDEDKQESPVVSVGRHSNSFEEPATRNNYHDEENDVVQSTRLCKDQENNQDNDGAAATTKSSPIAIPTSKSFNHHQHQPDDNSFESGGGSPSTSPNSRWRDAWSTDDETPVVARSDVIRVAAVSSEAHDDMDMAPSSPTEHFDYHHHHHHHHRHHHSGDHHHKRSSRHQQRHHHRNHANREGREAAGGDHSSTESPQEETESNEAADALRQSLADIRSSLCEDRSECGRPEDVTLMTRQQIRMEKMAMQRELLKFETERGRPNEKWERDIMRDIYDRYRMVKRLLQDTMSPTLAASHTLHHHHRRSMHQPITTNNNSNTVTDECDFLVTRELQPLSSSLLLNSPRSTNNKLLHPSADDEDDVDKKAIVDQLQVSGDTDINDLKKQQQETKHKKKKLRRKIRDFEREFKRQHQRSPSHADMVVMATEYAKYREVRARLRLLEALIEKQQQHC